MDMDDLRYPGWVQVTTNPPLSLVLMFLTFGLWIIPVLVAHAYIAKKEGRYGPDTTGTKFLQRSYTGR